MSKSDARPSETTCSACIASRRSVVDAFFAGARYGFRSAVNARIESYGESPPVPLPTFCLAHERMHTEMLADEIRKGMER